MAGMMFHFWIKEGDEERNATFLDASREDHGHGRTASHEENGSPILSRCRGQFGGLDPLCHMEIRLDCDPMLNVKEFHN